MEVVARFKRGALDCGQRIGQSKRDQVIVLCKCSFAHFGYAVRDNQLSDVAVIERAVADFDQCARECDLFQMIALVECIFLNGNNTLGNDDAFQRIAVVERIRMDGSQAYGQRDGFQCRAVAECVAADFDDAVGELNACQRRAICECIRCYFGNRVSVNTNYHIFDIACVADDVCGFVIHQRIRDAGCIRDDLFYAPRNVSGLFIVPAQFPA